MLILHTQHWHRRVLPPYVHDFWSRSKVGVAVFAQLLSHRGWRTRLEGGPPAYLCEFMELWRIGRKILTWPCLLRAQRNLGVLAFEAITPCAPDLRKKVLSCTTRKTGDFIVEGQPLRHVQFCNLVQSQSAEGNARRACWCQMRSH